VLGNEFAGEVEAVGRGVTSFTVGDRVFGFDGSRFGAHAEYLAVPEDGFLATVPAGLTYEEVAPSTEGSLYAQTLIRSPRSGGDTTSWSTARPGPSARRRSSCCTASAPG
jgi:NADPH:quinone reductase-like Zn-dependent oxidoreductase